jgi:hypothetical protein
VNAPLRAPAPGRVCPLDYRYGPAVFARPAELAAPALYVAGGVYGNLPALEAAEAMARAEPGAVLVINGDVHWFDAEPAWFVAIETLARRHPAIRGNVETELARGVDPDTGCGCSYPASVDEGAVARSNAIIGLLARAAESVAGARGRFAALPMHFVVRVGEARVAIVHGDAEALAGWRFDRASLDDPRARSWFERVRNESGVDVFASTHTCAPVMRLFDLPSGRMVIANNGATGMPNGMGAGVGIVTRIGIAPAPAKPYYGARVAGAHVDALPLPYDHAAFLSKFDRQWPEGSPAARSYRGRIVGGSVMDIAVAAPPGN